MIIFQAQNKELDTEYSRLQQQYFRLSSEHSTLNNQQKRNYQLFKEQKANEITSLDGNVTCSLTVPIQLVVQFFLSALVWLFVWLKIDHGQQYF